MQKTAQTRTMYNRIREMSNISGISMEKLFSDEFRKSMEDIRQKDNKIRAIASGKEIDKEDPGPDPISLKDLLKSAKSNFSRREYMIVIDELGRFHKKMLSINALLKSLASPDQEAEDMKVHRELLLKNLDPDRRSRLSELGNSFASTTTADGLIVQAAVREKIEDFLARLPGSRGRALAAWERAYPEHVKAIKKDTQTLLNESEKLFIKLIGGLKEMASARSVRSPGVYRKAASKLSGEFTNYHSLFETYWKSHIKDFKDIISKAPVQQAPAATVPDAKELGKQEVVAPEFDASKPSGIELDTIPSPAPNFEDARVAPGSPALKPQRLPQILPPPMAPPAGGGIEGGPPAGGPMKPPQTQLELPLGKSSHRTFYEELESLSNEHPMLLAGFIKKYALNIQHSDPETSIQLLQVVRSIKKQ